MRRLTLTDLTGVMPVGPETSWWSRRNASGIGEVCAEYRVPLIAAALRFPLGHPTVASVVVGCHTAAEVEADVAAFRTPIPTEFWASLRERGLLRADAPLTGFSRMSLFSATGVDTFPR